MCCALPSDPCPGRQRLASRPGTVRTTPTGWRLSLWTLFSDFEICTDCSGILGRAWDRPRVARPRIPGPTSGASCGTFLRTA
eukprot:4844888-Pyramimonas_sp.AAC.1